MEQALLPAETIIRYSKLNLLWYLALWVACEWAFLHHVMTVRPLGFLVPFWFLLCLAGVFFIPRQLWLLFHNRPQLTLSEGGIRLGPAPLDAWETIQDEEVRKVRRNRGTDTMLHYRAGSEIRELNIRELAVSSSQLTQLLQYYRARFKAKHH